MSRSLFCYIELKDKEGKYNAFSVLRKRSKYDFDENGETTVEEFEINGETYIKDYVFNFNYLNLRDSVFDSYHGELARRGLPNDVSDKVKDLTKNCYTGDNIFGYHFTYCTIEELYSLREKYQEEYKNELLERERIDYIAKIWKRMGYVPEKTKEDNSDYDEDAYEEEELNDKMWIARDLGSLAETVTNLIETVENDYYLDNNIRLIIWIA